MKNKICLLIIYIALKINDTYKRGLKANLNMIANHLLRDNRGEVNFDNLLADYPDVMDVKTLQNALGIGRNTAYDLIGSGKIKSIRIGKLVKLLKTDVLDFLRDSRYNNSDSDGDSDKEGGAV